MISTLCSPASCTKARAAANCLASRSTPITRPVGPTRRLRGRESPWHHTPDPGTAFLPGDRSGRASLPLQVPRREPATVTALTQRSHQSANSPLKHLSSVSPLSQHGAEALLCLSSLILVDGECTVKRFTQLG